VWDVGKRLGIWDGDCELRGKLCGSSRNEGYYEVGEGGKTKRTRSLIYNRIAFET
jgi:hypothetical protein